MGREVTLHLQVIINDLLKHVFLHASKPRTPPALWRIHCKSRCGVPVAASRTTAPPMQSTGHHDQKYHAPSRSYEHPAKEHAPEPPICAVLDQARHCIHVNQKVNCGCSNYIAIGCLGEAH
jgi:hypothetical protein